MLPPSLDEKIAPANIVRLIDAFVDLLDIESLGFTIRHKNKPDPGAPEYDPADLLKIYIYGYINRIRSSRQLEQCCRINIEMMWLANGLTPGHVTIAKSFGHSSAFSGIVRSSFLSSLRMPFHSLCIRKPGLCTGFCSLASLSKADKLQSKPHG